MIGNKTNYQVIKYLQQIISDDEKRHKAESLIILAVPIAFEEGQMPDAKRTIDPVYFRSVTLRISSELALLDPGTIDSRIAEYNTFLDSFKVYNIRRKKGFEDIYFRSARFLDSMRKGQDPLIIGRSIESKLPSYYRNMGLGDGEDLSPKRFGLALKQEYLLFCRTLHKLK